MKIFLMTLLILGLVPMTDLHAQPKAVGATCQSDADCEGGVCLDLTTIVDVCKGKVCTQTCTKAADCPKAAADPQCITHQGKKICQYGEWDKKYCQ